MNIHRLLQDLYAERRWLETMIAALEIASRSPTDRFARTLVGSLCEGASQGSLLLIPWERKVELARLAGQVRRAEALRQARLRRTVVTFGSQPRSRVAA